MTSAYPPAPSRDTSAGWPLNAWLLLALYFGAHMLCRTLISPALELDEAEQVLWTQRLEWGYGAQPPLYTWLQWGVFQLFGASVLTLSLLKNLLLASTYACVYLAGRLLMPARLAALAAASMLLLPQIGWESSRDLTHSVLMTALAAATLYQVLALLERPRPGLYLALGITVGLGILSKYSYALFALALLIALLAGRDTRRVLASRWTLAAIVLAVLVVTPHGLWLVAHWQHATEATMGKLEIDPSTTGRAADAARGLLSLLLSVLGFLWPWLLVMGLVFGTSLRKLWQARAAAATRTWDPGALWLRYALALALLFLAMVLFGQVTRFKDRWMQPFLFCVPLMVLCGMPGLVRHARLAWWRNALTGVAVLVLVLLALRPMYHALRDKPNQLNLPVPALVQALRDSGYGGNGTILTLDPSLGGSLRLQFPKAHVQTVQAGQAASVSDRPLLVIEEIARVAKAPEASQPIAPWVATQPVVSLALPYLHAGPAAEPARFRYQLLR